MSQSNQLIQSVKQNVAKVIVGKQTEIEYLLVALFSGGHVLLEDTPGTGKTTLAKTIARSLGMDYKRVQFTPDLLPSDVTGIQFFNPKKGEFEVQFGPVMTNLMLADEINRATPRTQSSLLEAMEERQITIEGKAYPLPYPFMVIATQNPIESHGTFPLPEAQLDRFLMKLPLGQSTRDAEKQILRRFRNDEPLNYLEPVISAEQIEKIKEEVRAVHLSDSVEDYLLDLVDGVRRHEAVEIGVSPRAILAMMRAGQAYALLQGRDFVTPDDMKRLAVVVWAHRVVLKLEAELHGSAEEVLRHVIEHTPVPVESISR